MWRGGGEGSVKGVGKGVGRRVGGWGGAQHTLISALALTIHVYIAHESVSCYFVSSVVLFNLSCVTMKLIYIHVLTVLLYM